MMGFFDVVLKASVVVGAGLGAVACLRSRSAALRHFILASALAIAGLMPLAQSVMPPWLPSQLVAAPPASPPVMRVPPNRTEVETTSVVIAPQMQAQTPLMPGVVSPPRTPLFRGVLLVWIAGTLISLVPMVFGFVRLRRLARAARSCADPAWAEAVEARASACGLRHRPQLLLTGSPLLATWGVRRARILLPDEATEWPARRARIVIAHEVAHIVRRDWFVHVLAAAVRALYWFHPVVWIACRRLRLESERACDDVVLNDGVGAEDYATELVEVARVIGVKQTPWLPAPAMARASDLEGRVTAMLNNTVCRTPLTGQGRAFVLASMGALMLSLGGAVLLAQTYSSFTGTTRDEFNTPISGVTLTLGNAGSGQKYEVKSNAVGMFEFVGLPNGDYELRSSLPGFQTKTSALTIVGRNLQRDVDLRVGSLEETVSVLASSSNPGSSGGPLVRPRMTPPPTPACTPSPISGKIRPPTKIASANPRYPESARQAGSAGVIVLNAVIATDGTIREATSVDPSADPELVAAAIDAVKLWEFTPTLLNCTAVEVNMKVRVRFSTEP